MFNDFLNKKGFVMTAKRKKTINIFWRIYFFAYLIILIIFVIPYVPNKNIWPASIPIKMMDVVFCIINATGLFAYTYEKNIFKPVFWKVFFPVLLIWHFYLNVFVMPVTTPGNTTALGWIMIDLSIHTPLYTAIFLYAFKYKRRIHD